MTSYLPGECGRVLVPLCVHFSLWPFWSATVLDVCMYAIHADLNRSICHSASWQPLSVLTIPNLDSCVWASELVGIGVLHCVWKKFPPLNSL